MLMDIKNVIRFFSSYTQPIMVLHSHWHISAKGEFFVKSSTTRYAEKSQQCQRLEFSEQKKVTINVRQVLR